MVNIYEESRADSSSVAGSLRIILVELSLLTVPTEPKLLTVLSEKVL